MREHLCQILAHYVLYFRWRLNLPISHDTEPLILKGAPSRWHKKGLFQWSAAVNDKTELDTEDWSAEDFLENNVEGSLNSIGLDTGFSSEMPLRSPSNFKCDAQPRSTNATSTCERFLTWVDIAPLSIVDPPGPSLVYLSACQSAEASNEDAFAEDIDAYNSACLGQIQPPSTYTSNRSEKEAAPWSGLILQHDAGPILPGNINDTHLSSLLQMCFASSRLSSTEGLSDPSVERANSFPAKRPYCSRAKTQNGNRGQNARRVPQTKFRKYHGLSGVTRHPALGSAASNASMNIARGGRLEGFHLPEEDRIAAKEVRPQGACFRCWVTRDMVCS